MIISNYNREMLKIKILITKTTNYLILYNTKNSFKSNFKKNTLDARKLYKIQTSIIK